MPTVRELLDLSDDDYEWMLELTDYRCWICGNEELAANRRLAVDHDHRTGAIRGLLCTRCNRRLGAATNPEWFDRAGQYLRVAARAFGDNCESCGKSSPSRLVKTGDQASVFEHSCCGRVWRVTYRTKGIPFGWELSGYPAPPYQSPIDPCDPAVGHPGTERKDPV